MNISIDFSKIAKFILVCMIIVGAIFALGAIYEAYIVDQNLKIAHYNDMVDMCNKKPGAIADVTASTPVVGTGIEFHCRYIVPKRRF